MQHLRLIRLRGLSIRLPVEVCQEQDMLLLGTPLTAFHWQVSPFHDHQERMMDELEQGILSYQLHS